MTSDPLAPETIADYVHRVAGRQVLPILEPTSTGEDEAVFVRAAKALEEDLLQSLRADPGVLAARRQVAIQLRHRGDLTGARELQAEIVAASVETHGSTNPETLAAMRELAVTLSDLGELKAAAELRHQVLDAQVALERTDQASSKLGRESARNRGPALVVLAYPDEGTAEQAHQTVRALESDLIIQADQVASISRDSEGKYHVHTTHAGASAGAGAAWGGFWGLLFGLLFFIPFAGLALGAGMGALFGHMGEKGIDKAFQEEVRESLKPGTSALFMVIEQATPDKAIAALQQYGGTVIKTSLSDEDTKRLQEALQPPSSVSSGA